MGTLERFMLVVGDQRVMRALGWTVLMVAVALILIMTDNKSSASGVTLLIALLCAVPFVLVGDYLKGRPGNLIQTIEEVAEETEQLNEDDARDPEDRRLYAWRVPEPTFDLVDPATPDPPLIKALDPTTRLNWPNSGAEQKDGD